MAQMTNAVLDWLLEGDPAIRWQALRDLRGAAERTVTRERKRVAREGWGAQLLALQDAEGTWAHGLYTPKWTSTHYTLMLLRDFGLPPDNEQARQGCRLLLDGGLQPDGGIYPGATNRQGETCVTGMTLSLLSYFALDDERLDIVAAHLLGEQMPDGGWNCRRPRGATHSSFNTTISALEGLRHYELHRVGALRQAQGTLRAVRAAQGRAREFLLQHRLFRSHRTGNIVKTIFTRFSFPPRWHYDILRALDHFRDVNAPRDPRLADAIAIVNDTRLPDGRWNLQNTYSGKVFFNLESRGAPSRWNTLRALRVLKWWERRA